MVHADKLDEAEAAARDLLVRFPEVHDGYDRLGMVYEARGDKKQAADYYRQVGCVTKSCCSPRAADGHKRIGHRDTSSTGLLDP